MGWSNPTLDADYAMTPWFDPEDAFGIAHFSDDDLLELLNRAQETPLEEE